MIVVPDRGLFGRFADVAGRHPDRVALLHGEHRVSFERLHARAVAIGAGLASRGLTEGELVGVELERSPDHVAAVLGCFAAGAAVLPLPPSYPEEVLRRTVDFARPALVLDAEAGIEALIEAGDGAELPSPAPDPDRLAFVLSSSGSTGRPKLIARTHRSFFHRLDWTAERHPFGEGEVGCQKAHATTTHAIYELFEPLLAGMPTLIVPDDEVRDLERFWARVREHGVTRLLLVPSALRASLGLPGFDPPPALRVLVLMGEHVTPELADAAVAAFRETTALYSIYGSTEASSALVTDLRGARGPAGEVALGAPIRPEVRALVLDDEGAAVGPGGEGRLYLTGPNLFEGYHGDPERTEGVMVRAPDTDAALYDTHDLVRVGEGGVLLYRGRADDFVKIRGFPVVLHEVEAALRAVPGVDDAVALVDAHATEPTLLGFVVPEVASTSGVLDELRRTLPSYMVPSAVVGLDRWPRTRSGKIDRHVLAASRAPDPEPDPAPDPAWDADQRLVAEAWRAVTGHAPRDLDESFFEAGGTSLNVYRLVARLDAAAEGLAAAQIYRHPTVREMAALVAEVRAGRRVPEGAVPVAASLRAGGRPGLEPLFVLASAGGTLGAYELVAREYSGDREVVGLRDPYLWGGRTLHEGFDAWVGRFLDALRDRQPDGPYHLVAYSSAGAFGWELARRLREAGAEVRALVLIEPVGLARETDERAGRAFQAIWQGRLRRALARLRLGSGEPSAGPASPPDLAEDVARALRNPRHMLFLSALLELNTGMPYTLDAADLADVPPDGLIDHMLRRVGEVSPEVDPELIRRLAAQYELQVRTQQTYRLARLDVPVTLFVPRSPIAGLMPGVLRPWTADLRARRLPVGRPTPRVRAITARFGPLATHYRSMRDEVFARALARELERL